MHRSEVSHTPSERVRPTPAPWRVLDTFENMRRAPTRLAVVSAATVVAVVLALVLASITSGRSSTPPPATGSNLSQAIANVTHVPASVLNEIGLGGHALSAGTVGGPLSTIHPPVTDLPEVDGKPAVFYLGAEWCPYCATERWSLIIALSRFGVFRNLGGTESSATDVYPNTQTFTFAGSTYLSRYFTFLPVEIQTRTGAPLGAPTAAESAVLKELDADGSIPFIDIGNRFLASLPSWDNPALLSGLSRGQVAQDLTHPSSPVARAIDANANYLTAALCRADGGKPASVCASPAVATALRQLSGG